MTRNYDIVKFSSTTLAEIMSVFHGAIENVSFQLNQWIVAELSSDTPCAGGVEKVSYVANRRNLTTGFD